MIVHLPDCADFRTISRRPPPHKLIVHHPAAKPKDADCGWPGGYGAGSGIVGVGTGHVWAAGYGGIAPVPEPSSLALIGIGFAAAWVVSKRKRRGSDRKEKCA